MKIFLVEIWAVGIWKIGLWPIDKGLEMCWGCLVCGYARFGE
jgi:hypothetical protein